MRGGLAAVIVVAVLVAAGGASATESTIVPGVGIGKVHLGTTLSQVQRLLGRDYVVNARRTVSNAAYRELAWNFGSVSVGFLQQRSAYRVAQVATTLRAQRTGSGLGVGSAFKAVVHAYPQAICAEYFEGMGSTAAYGIGPGTRFASPALVVAKNRMQLAFLVHADKNDSRLWFVYEVVVRHTVQGAVDFVPHEECAFGWQQRGTPNGP